MGEPGYGPGKLIFEAVDAATNQEITEKTSYENISSEKMAGQAWSQDALRLVRINGIGISFDNTSYETLATTTNWWLRTKKVQPLRSVS